MQGAGLQRDVQGKDNKARRVQPAIVTPPVNFLPFSRNATLPPDPTRLPLLVNREC